MNEGKIPFVAHKTSHIIAFIIIGIVIVDYLLRRDYGLYGNNDDGNGWIFSLFILIFCCFFGFFRETKKKKNYSIIIDGLNGNAIEAFTCPLVSASVIWTGHRTPFQGMPWLTQRLPVHRPGLC